MPVPSLAICIVTYNSAEDLPGCFAALAVQDWRGFEVVVVDCASADASVETARSVELGDIPRQIVPLDENRGFSGGMNEAFRHTAAPLVLTLNADTRPRSDFLRRLLERFDAASVHLKVGAVTPRLLRPPDPDGTVRLDACGMHLIPAWRHLDRGSGEVDRGQHGAPELVFGATGAAALLSRAALDDVAIDGDAFDPLFHSFREDAELCFRLRERGWEVIYEPRAVAEHRRRVIPGRRRKLPPGVNCHSLKNRYLLRAYHQTPKNFIRTFLPTLGRDLLAFGYVVMFEHTSLPAYAWLWRNRREIWQRRRLIQSRRTARVRRWFFERSRSLEKGDSGNG